MYVCRACAGVHARALYLLSQAPFSLIVWFFFLPSYFMFCLPLMSLLSCFLGSRFELPVKRP